MDDLGTVAAVENLGERVRQQARARLVVPDRQRDVDLAGVGAHQPAGGALHQPPSLMKPGPGTMPGVIVTALMVNFVAFSLLYVYFVAKRVDLLRREAEAAA